MVLQFVFFSHRYNFTSVFDVPRLYSTHSTEIICVNVFGHLNLPSDSLYLLDAFDDNKQESGLRSSHNLWNKTTSPSDISRLQRRTKFQHSVLHGKLALLGHCGRCTAQDITVASADEQLLNSPLIFSNKPRISSSVLLLTFE